MGSSQSKKDDEHNYLNQIEEVIIDDLDWIKDSYFTNESDKPIDGKSSEKVRRKAA